MARRNSTGLPVIALMAMMVFFALLQAIEVTFFAANLRAQFALLAAFLSDVLGIGILVARIITILRLAAILVVALTLMMFHDMLGYQTSQHRTAAQQKRMTEDAL